MSHDSLYKIALSFIPGVGPVLARKLVAYIGSVEGVFKEKFSTLAKVPGIGTAILNGINVKTILEKAEEELTYLVKHNIHHLFYLDGDYPNRLKECEDAPIVLFYKGQSYFNLPKIVSIVGTRRSTAYGDEMCSKLVSDMAQVFPELVVVSGFAYGIDICAHKAALQSNLKTIAVFGHGVEEVYPAVHKKYINRLLENGAVVSEFPSKKKPDPGNFVSRNRIIAGLADATIVVESGKKGGSLLTADMALSYNRDVFTFPGRAGDHFSKGCNNLIKNNRAALIESANDLIMHMRWDVSENTRPVQQNLFLSLSLEEEQIINALKNQNTLSIDQLSRILKLHVSKLSSLLLNLEFNGLVNTLPGKSYKLK